MTGVNKILIILKQAKFFFSVVKLWKNIFFFFLLLVVHNCPNTIVAVEEDLKHPLELLLFMAILYYLGKGHALRQ